MAFNDPFNSNNVPNDGNTSNNFYNFNNEDADPAAEFLEREKRELGDITGDGDANSFDTNQNSLTNGINT
jgi:hypothetical protein